MKLYELFEETRDEYFNRLTKELNIEKLGSGYFATVFQHPTHPDVAVKYFEEDPGYQRFLKLCQDHPKNVWLPKIIGLEKVKMDSKHGGDKDAFIVFMEKLQKCTEVDRAEATKRIIGTLPKSFHEEFAEIKDFNGDLCDFEDRHWVMIRQNSDDFDLRVLAKFIDENSTTNDLHAENMMMRGKQLVITDPLS